jgi:amino acid adenylation domain-containing protein
MPLVPEQDHEVASSTSQARWRTSNDIRHQCEPISRRPSVGPEPLSLAQQRIWLATQIEPDGPVYNIPVVFDVHGPLDPAVLERALNEIIRRHEILRTRFFAEAGVPAQYAQETAPMALTLIDLSAMPSPGQEITKERCIACAARVTFNLGRPPLVRGSVFRLSPQSASVMITFHHIVFDGWSTSVFVRELGTLYEAFAGNRPSPLSELPLQYGDYAAWQRRVLQGEGLQKQLRYWRTQLADAPEALDLAGARAEMHGRTHAAAQEALHLPADLTPALKACARRDRATLFMTMATAFLILLQRYTGQDDVVVGTVNSHRPRIETEPLIGFFVNTIALRVNLSGDPSWSEALRRTKETCVAAITNSDVPFEKVLEEVKPFRNSPDQALFNVLITFKSFPKASIRHAAQLFTIKNGKTSVGTTAFPLSLALDENEVLEGSFRYHIEVYEREVIRRMAEHYRILLHSIVADPHLRISQFNVISESERLQILHSWNPANLDLPCDTCVHSLFERQAAATPDRIAAVFGDVQITYRELDRRAGLVSAHLCRFSVAAEDRVAIYLAASLDMLIAVLGVLKSGAAYVPLDPSHPRRRTATILEDAIPAVVITSQDLVRQAPANSGRILLMDAEWPSIESSSNEPIAVRVDPKNLCYIIHTSGSTGTPKGVQIQHRSLVNLLIAMGSEPGISIADVVLATTTLSFDIAALEIYLPLITGARVIIASRDIVCDTPRVSTLIEESHATLIQATPTWWRMQVDAGWPGSTHAMILCGGEALDRDLASVLAAKAPAVWNMYGPTETTIWSASNRLPLRAVNQGAALVGLPTRNTTFFVVGNNGDLAPVGVTGELWIGGEGLARGYWRQPGLTAERFVPDPFGSVPGARLYRTGDLVRRSADGKLQFLGRIDSQVKINGNRIEVAEIEATLRQVAGVRQATVVVREDKPAEKRLTAYVVCDSPVTSTEILARVRQSLPHYMTPHAIVFISEMPLTANGKVNRKALPAPVSEPACFEAPRTVTEEILADIWASIISCERVARDDDFFHLGGHSLLGTQMLSHVLKTFRVELSLRDLFEARTVANLAAIIDNASSAEISQRLEAALDRVEMLTPEQVEAALGGRKREVPKA